MLMGILACSNVYYGGFLDVKQCCGGTIAKLSYLATLCTPSQCALNLTLDFFQCLSFSRSCALPLRDDQ